MANLESAALNIIFGPLRVSQEEEETANKYLTRAGLYAGRVTSLKKLRKTQRIALGKRPLEISQEVTWRTYLGKWDGVKYYRETRAILHPTKGYKDVKVRTYSNEG